MTPALRAAAQRGPAGQAFLVADANAHIFLVDFHQPQRSRPEQTSLVVTRLPGCGYEAPPMAYPRCTPDNQVVTGHFHVCFFTQMASGPLSYRVRVDSTGAASSWNESATGSNSVFAGTGPLSSHDWMRASWSVLTEARPTTQHAVTHGPQIKARHSSLLIYD